MMLVHRHGAGWRVLSLVAALVVALSVIAVGQDRAVAVPGPSFANPVVPAPNSADPTLVQYNGRYYYVATTWTSDVLMRGVLNLMPNNGWAIDGAAGYCGTPDYKLGMLEYRGGDPLAASSWSKFANPIFQRNDANRVFDPGHHSFFTSPDGTEIWIAYDANSSASQGCGTTRVQKILTGPSGETGR